MKPSRREMLAGLAATPFAASIACGGAPAWRADGEAALARAVAWSWSQQDAAGGWPSRTYGLLASGQSTTAFVLRSLLDVPPALVAFRATEASAALAFLLGKVDPCGAIGFASDPPDYPMYATALAVQALARTRAPGWESAAAPLLAWIRAQQCGTPFAGRPHAGGFPMGAKDPPSPDAALHVDLSMTRRALEALALAGAGADDEAIVAGRAFVERSQVVDGGFVYSAAEAALNKGVPAADGTPGGYGSATTDGVLALLACGAAVDDPRVQRGVEWLVRHHRTDANPGVSGGPWDAFAVAMRGYYRAGAAAVFHACGRGPADWQAGIVAAVIAEQRADGSLAAAETLQKEDDPLVATGFAVQALSLALA